MKIGESSKGTKRKNHKKKVRSSNHLLRGKYPRKPLKEPFELTTQGHLKKEMIGDEGEAFLGVRL